MIVTFCGHRIINPSEQEKNALRDVLRNLLRRKPDIVFYLGDYGQFDALCNHTLKLLQVEFPLPKRIFVTPYRDENYSHLQYANERYDEILYPFETRIMPKMAILLRNRWMVDKRK